VNLKNLRFTVLPTKNYPDPLREIKYDKNDKTDIPYKMTSNRIPLPPPMVNLRKNNSITYSDKIHLYRLGSS
jgi:hypothetical protein